MFFLAKVIRDTKNEEYGKDFFLWEKDSSRLSCRKCNSQFTAFNRRHHCRLCGGLFCESCTITNVIIDDETIDRICNGCVHHETPGKKIRGDIESRISTRDGTELGSGKSEEQVSLVVCPQFDYGSVFEPNSVNSKGSDLAVSPPASGYFELINKSSSFCAIKVLVHPTDLTPSVTQILYEISRPSYISVPPGELVNCDVSPAMDTAQGVVDLLILYHNPNLIPADINSINYNTKKPLKISPCASIENFLKVAVFRICCKGKNILLKFKGENQLEPRVGNSIDRKGGLLNALTGSSKSDGKDLDFTTNITASAIAKIV